LSVRYSAPRCSSTSSKSGAKRRLKGLNFAPALALLPILGLAACASDNLPTLVAAPPGTETAEPAATDSTPTPPAISQRRLSGINAPPADSLIGKAGSDLVLLLGRPGLVHKERDAEIWQYSAASCVMLFYLYDGSDGARRITYFEAVPQGLTSLASTSGDAPQTCLAYQMLAASGKPLS